MVTAPRSAARAIALAAIVLFVAPAGCMRPDGPPALRYGSLVRTASRIDYTPRIRWSSLPNGLTVGLTPDDRGNVVSVDLRFLVGAADDPPGKSGLAHLVAYLVHD